jgi:cyanophycinase
MGQSSQAQKTTAQKKRKKIAQRAKRPAKGTLYIIGGREDKKNERAILKEIAQRVASGKLVIATLATDYVDKSWEQYKSTFTSLGVKSIAHLSIERRDEETEEANLELIEGAVAIFFTGGDQLKITAKLGGTRLSEEIEQLFLRGGIIAGTSAGAAAMSEMMLIPGISSHLHTVRDAFQMVPGLGLIKNVIIDQHFSERGRIRRLLGAVAQNPRMIGVGIDEDTAIVVREESFRVIGSGAVYIADGRALTHTNISENSLDRTMSVFNIKLHILSENDSYDLKAHQPIPDEQDVTMLKKGLRDRRA